MSGKDSKEEKSSTRVSKISLATLMCYLAKKGGTREKPVPTPYRAEIDEKRLNSSDFFMDLEDILLKMEPGWGLALWQAAVDVLLGETQAAAAREHHVSVHGIRQCLDVLAEQLKEYNS